MAKSEIKMKMSLDSSGVKAGLLKAKTSIANFAKEANQKLGSVAKFAAGGLVAGFAAASRSALEYGKEVKSLAQVSNASLEEFQKLAVGAKTVGVEHDKLADIFKDMNDRVGDFVHTGGGPMADFFEKIAPLVGVTADEFRNLSGPQALQLYYDSLEKANLSQEDMTFYMEAIASDSTKLIPLLADGGKAFKDLGDDAEAAGLVMSSSTADNLAKAQTTIDNFKQKAVIKVGELISGKANFAALKALGAYALGMLADVGEKIINTVMSGVKTVIASLASVFVVISENIRKAMKLVGLEGAKAIAPIVNKMSELLNNIGFDIEKWDTSKIQGEIDKINFDNPIQRMGQLSTEYKQGLDELIPPLKGAGDAARELGDTYQRMADTSGIVAEEQKKRTQEAIKQTNIESQAVQKNTEQFRLQQELKDAILRGDLEAVDTIENALKMEKDILKVMEDHKINREEATAHVQALIDKEQEQAEAKKGQNAEEEEALRQLKGLELEKIRAEAAGNTDLADELQKRIDKQQTALDLMNKFGISIGEAKNLAEQLAAVNGGPNIDQMQIGGGIENVSRKKRETGRVRDRAAEAKESRLRRAENAEIQRRRNRGEDMADVMADINARRAARAGGGGKPGGPPPNGGPAGPGGGGGGGGGDGKEPKKPEDPAKVTNDKLDEQIGLLKDIKTALKC